VGGTSGYGSASDARDDPLRDIRGSCRNDSIDCLLRTILSLTARSEGDPLNLFELGVSLPSPGAVTVRYGVDLLRVGAILLLSCLMARDSVDWFLEAIEVRDTDLGSLDTGPPDMLLLDVVRRGSGAGCGEWAYDRRLLMSVDMGFVIARGS
jgi:hypothetical protein